MIPFRAFVVAALYLLKTASYLQLPGVTGESTDEKHKNWIALESVSFGVTNASASGTGAGGRTSSSRTASHDVQVTKLADRSSAQLMQAVANGRHFATAEIDVGTTRYMLKEVIISSVQQTGHGSGGGQPTEHLTLNYASLEIVYPPKPGTTAAAGAAAAPRPTTMAAPAMAAPPAAPPTAPTRAMAAAPATMSAPAATSPVALEQQLTQSLSGAGRTWVATEGRALSQNNGSADQLVAAARQSAQSRFGAQPANVTNALAFLALMDATKADHNLAQLQPAIRKVMGATNASAAGGLANLR